MYDRAGLTFGLYVSFAFKPELKQDDLKKKIHSNTHMDGSIMNTVRAMHCVSNAQAL
jgi:hypothetical protein